MFTDNSLANPFGAFDTASQVAQGSSGQCALHVVSGLARLTLEQGNSVSLSWLVAGALNEPLTPGGCGRNLYFSLARRSSRSRGPSEPLHWVRQHVHFALGSGEGRGIRV